MVQLKGELWYLIKKNKKRSKNVDFNGFFNEKNPQNRAKYVPFQI